MTRTARLLSLTALLVPAAAAAQSANPMKHTPRPTAPAITAADLMTRLYIFADDSMQGREAGTLGNLKGTDYIGRELARLGLRPAGDSGSFFQDFALETSRPTPGGRFTVDGTPLTTGSDYLFFPAIGLPAIGRSFALENTPVVYGGKLGDPSLVSPDAVAGKLVLFSPADGPNSWQFWSRFGPPQYTRYAGAAGILIAALDEAPPQLAEFFSGGQVTLPNPNAQPGTISLMLVTGATAERLMGGTLAGVLAGTEGKSASITAGMETVPTAAPGRNVVAIVPGTDPTLAQQYVAIGAHNDHDGFTRPVDHDSLRAFNTVVRPEGAEDSDAEATPARLDTVATLLAGLRTRGPVRMDSVMNGADDDGSGSVALLELAEYFASRPARRSILLVWHAAEEKGLFGAGWFTDNPTVPRDSIVAQLNADMIGRGMEDDLPDGGISYLQLIGSRRLSAELGDLVEEVNTRGNHGFRFDYQYDANGHPQQFYCRSDHYMYARYGIPIVFFSTGSHRDYHQPTDEPQYINYPKLAAVTDLMRDVAESVANREARIALSVPRPAPGARCVQ